MPETQAQRTLVKSPPELWAELSDPAALARHLGELGGEIKITRIEPETTVVWEGERATGRVELTPSGWGTKVTLTVATATPQGRPPDASQADDDRETVATAPEALALEPTAMVGAADDPPPEATAMAGAADDPPLEATAMAGAADDPPLEATAMAGAADDPPLEATAMAGASDDPALEAPLAAPAVPVVTDAPAADRTAPPESERADGEPDPPAARVGERPPTLAIAEDDPATEDAAGADPSPTSAAAPVSAAPKRGFLARLFGRRPRVDAAAPTTALDPMPEEGGLAAPAVDPDVPEPLTSTGGPALEPSATENVAPAPADPPLAAAADPPSAPVAGEPASDDVEPATPTTTPPTATTTPPTAATTPATPATTPATPATTPPTATTTPPPPTFAAGAPDTAPTSPEADPSPPSAIPDDAAPDAPTSAAAGSDAAVPTAPAPEAPAPPALDHERANELLGAVLDTLGAAHHRPFSRS